MERDNSEIKQAIIDAGYIAIEQLIGVAREDIMRPYAKQKKGGGDDDGDGDDSVAFLAADRLKNAAQAKKMAIFDAFEILTKIETEKQSIKDAGADERSTSNKGFAERRSK